MNLVIKNIIKQDRKLDMSDDNILQSILMTAIEELNLDDLNVLKILTKCLEIRQENQTKEMFKHLFEKSTTKKPNTKDLFNENFIDKLNQPLDLKDFLNY